MIYKMILNEFNKIDFQLVDVLTIYFYYKVDYYRSLLFHYVFHFLYINPFLNI